jgi:competence protein ComEA
MNGFDYKELLFKFRYPILILLVGLILVGGGFFFYKSGLSTSGTKVEVLSATDTNSGVSQNITVESAGEVIKSGVYKLPGGSRVDDLLTVSGGLTGKADREWTDKYLNRASKLVDGQKIYIPSVNSQSNVSTANKVVGDQTISPPNLSDSNGLININTASLSQLDSLPGIGPVFGQKIIEQRPYSTVEELLSKGVLKQSVYNKIKDRISIY